MYANKIRGNLDIVARSGYSYVLYTGADTRQQMLKRIVDVRKDMDDSYDRLGEIVRNEKSQKATQFFSDMRALRPTFVRVKVFKCFCCWFGGTVGNAKLPISAWDLSIAITWLLFAICVLRHFRAF